MHLEARDAGGAALRARCGVLAGIAVALLIVAGAAFAWTMTQGALFGTA